MESKKSSSVLSQIRRFLIPEYFSTICQVYQGI